MSWITQDDILLEEAVELQDSDIAEANRYIDRLILRCGRKIDDETLPKEHLKDLAITYAYWRAYLREMVANSDFEKKEEFYRKFKEGKEREISEILINKPVEIVVQRG